MNLTDGMLFKGTPSTLSKTDDLNLADGAQRAQPRQGPAVGAQGHPRARDAAPSGFREPVLGHAGARGVAEAGRIRVGTPPGCPQQGCSPGRASGSHTERRRVLLQTPPKIRREHEVRTSVHGKQRFASILKAEQGRGTPKTKDVTQQGGWRRAKQASLDVSDRTACNR